MVENLEQVALGEELFSFLKEVIDKRNSRLGRNLDEVKDKEGFIEIKKKDYNGQYSIMVLAKRSEENRFMYDREPIFQLDLWLGMKGREIHVFCDYFGKDLYYRLDQVDKAKTYVESVINSFN